MNPPNTRIFIRNLPPKITDDDLNKLFSKCGKIEEGDTMGTKRKVKIELNAKEEALVHYESEWGRNESIKRAARILHYANIGTETMRELCEKTGYDFETVSRMLKLFQTMGVDAIYQCRRGKRINHLEQISDELEAYFNENPPTDVPDAVRKIKEHFGINITATPVRYWLKAKAIRIKSQKAYRQKQI